MYSTGVLSSTLAQDTERNQTAECSHINLRHVLNNHCQMPVRFLITNYVHRNQVGSKHQLSTTNLSEAREECSCTSIVLICAFFFSGFYF